MFAAVALFICLALMRIVSETATPWKARTEVDVLHFGTHSSIFDFMNDVEWCFRVSYRTQRFDVVNKESFPVEDEKELTRKLFGDKHETAESSDGEGVTVVDEETQLTSIWHDEDDGDDDIQRQNNSSRIVLNGKYQDRLRRAFKRYQRGTPTWALLKRKVKVGQIEEDQLQSEVEKVLSELTQSSIRYVEKTAFHVEDIASSISSHATVELLDVQKINVVLFHNVRAVVFTGGASGRVQLLKVGDESKSVSFLQSVQFVQFPITSMCLLRGGRSVVCGSAHQEYLMKYELESGTAIQLELPKCIPRQNAGNFAVSKDGFFLAMIARNAQVHVLSTSSMELIKSFGAPADVTSIQFFPDSNCELWAMTERGEVVIWNLRGFQHVFRDKDAVRGTKIRISANGDIIACGSNTGIVNVYNVADVRNTTDPKPRSVVRSLPTSCGSIAFSGDGQIMAFSSSVKKNQVKLFNLASDTVFSNYPKNYQKLPCVECVEFSPHSAYFGIGCSDGRLIMERLSHYNDY